MADETLNILLRITGDETDADNTLDSLARKLQVLGGEDVTAKAGVDTATGEQKLRDLHQSLRDIGAVGVAPKAEVSTGTSAEKLNVLRAELKAIPDETVTVEVNTDRVRHGLVAAAGALSSLGVQGAFALAALGGAAIQAGVAIGGIGAAGIATLAPFGVLALAVKQRLKDGSGAATAFKGALAGLKAAFGQAFGPGADAVLQGITRGFQSITRMLPALSGGFTRLGQQAGHAIGALLTQFSNPRWTQFFQTMTSGATRAVEPLSRILSDLARIFRNIAEAGLPIFIDLLKKGADALGGLANKTSDIEALRAKIQQGVGILGQLVTIGKNAASAVLSIFKAGDSAGFLKAIRDATTEIANFLKSGKGQNSLKELFSAIVPFVRELAHAFPTLLPVLAQIVKAANAVFLVILKVAQGLAGIPVIGPTLAAVAVGFLAWAGPLKIVSALLGGIVGKLGSLAVAKIAPSLVAGAGAEAAGGAAGGAAAGAAGGAAGASFLSRFMSQIGLIPTRIALLFSGLGARLLPILGRAGPLAAAFGTVASTVVGVLGASDLGGKIANYLTGVLSATPVGWAVRLGQLVGTNIAGGLQSAGAAIGSAASSVANAIVSAVRAVVGAAGAAGRAVADAVRGGIAAIGGAVSGAARAVANGAVAGVHAFVGAAGSAGRAIGSAVQAGIGALGGAISGVARTVARGAVSAAGSLAGAAGSAGRAIGGGFRDGIAAVVGAVAGAARAVASGAVRAFGGLASAAASIGSNIAQSLANGIASGASSVIRAALGIAQSAWNAAKNFLGIGSPSKLFAEMGRNTAMGYAQGLRAEMASVTGGLTAALSLQLQDSRSALTPAGGLRPVGGGTVVHEHHYEVNFGGVMVPQDPASLKKVAETVTTAVREQNPRRNTTVRGA